MTEGWVLPLKSCHLIPHPTHTHTKNKWPGRKAITSTHMPTSILSIPCSPALPLFLSLLITWRLAWWPYFPILNTNGCSNRPTLGSSYFNRNLYTFLGLLDISQCTSRRWMLLRKKGLEIFTSVLLLFSPASCPGPFDQNVLHSQSCLNRIWLTVNSTLWIIARWCFGVSFSPKISKMLNVLVHLDIICEDPEI